MRKLRVAIFLFSVFFTSLAAVFLAIYLLPSPYFNERAYSFPETFWSFDIELLGGNQIGPALNATDVPLDTAVFIDLMRADHLERMQLHMSPEAPIQRQINKYFLAGGSATFVFAEPLKPDTTYNVTIIWGSFSITWNFTTTAESFYPRYEATPNQLGQLLTLGAATVTTCFVGVAVWKRKKEWLTKS
ncbi:MAG: Ig-like domain-containing protein [Candidatus Bathyarchaeota archaeon]|nr:Ig-like domain-containing protein [Candidatus Bathyarchaeota archaeon]